MKRYCLGIFLFIAGLCFIIPAFAQVRDLPGIDIVSREERGAHEERTWLDSSSWNSFRLFLTNYDNRLVAGGEDPDGEFAARKERKELEAKRRAFLTKEYPEEVILDRTIALVGSHPLVRSRQYHQNKTKIIIHHTAGPQIYDTPESALSGIQDIYKFHTLKRGWGDIGYNFLIDPYGTIYEGRAGGRGVVGGHADRNNVSTIGIALMGNFENEAPTEAARQALLHLTTVLALEFDIDPSDNANYFTTISHSPWLSVHKHKTLVGHSDTKITACPGKYVEDRLPELRSQIHKLISFIKKNDISFSDDFIFIDAPPAQYMTGDEGRIDVQLPHGGKVKCTSLSSEVDITNCIWGPNTTLQIYVRHSDYPASGTKTFVITIGNKAYLVRPTLVREQDLDVLSKERQQLYERIHGDISTTDNFKKISEKIPISSIEQYQKDHPVKVMLYDASTSLTNWDFSCPDGCTIEIDEGTLYDIHDITVLQFDGVLRVLTEKESVDTEKLTIHNDHLIVLENYERTFSDLPMNIFRGDIHIVYERYKHLDYGWTNKYVLINELPLKQYMFGVGEISEKQHDEKLKTMALLSKGYMLFYLDGKNVHPSIPKDASYNAIDDPRLFQKYLGASFEVYGTRWLEALAATEDEYISYDDYLPILPYFHCSAGFSKSGKDAFGRTDTPWLQRKLDIVTCQRASEETGRHFEGHGVGLSGDGAEAMAQAGMNYKQIIKWWYDGVDVEKII